VYNGLPISSNVVSYLFCADSLLVYSDKNNIIEIRWQKEKWAGDVQKEIRAESEFGNNIDVEPCRRDKPHTLQGNAEGKHF